MFPTLISSWAWGFLVLTTAYVLACAIYNLYFHPLARIPGPFLARASLLWRSRHTMGGRFHRVLQKQHEIYGELRYLRSHLRRLESIGKAFRVSPNEISFSSAQSLRDIYGAVPGSPTFTKSEFYDVISAGFESGSIGTERDPQVHHRMKRSLLSAFSTKSLREQESIVQGCIDKFLVAIGVEGQIEGGIDMTKWFEILAFDITGEMAFGESFGCIEQGEPHPWQQMVGRHLFDIVAIDNLRRYRLVRSLVKWLVPKLAVDVKNKVTGFSRNQVAKRLALNSNRKDFLTTFVQKVEEGEVSREELAAHVSTLAVGGGETVATFLAATTYYLCKHPKTTVRLQQEIRSRFKKCADIDAKSVMQMPYLQAVIQEGLRIYPPASEGFPRISPGAYVDGIWVPAGTEVFGSAWTITHMPSHFHRPDEFLPSRWLDEKCGDVKEASQPFSLGPRGCIGRKYASLLPFILFTFGTRSVADDEYQSFAQVELSLILAKMHFSYNLNLVDQALDWEGQSEIYMQWWKPALKIRIENAAK